MNMPLIDQAAINNNQSIGLTAHLSRIKRPIRIPFRVMRAAASA
jgi:hypothetical protein